MVLLWFFKFICLLDSYFIIKGCNSGTAGWKGRTGHGSGRGSMSSMPSAGIPSSQHLPVPPNLEASVTTLNVHTW